MFVVRMLLLSLLFIAPTGLLAGEIEFNRDIRPILSDKCFACHGPDANHREADLRLDERENAIQSRDGHRVITPGKPTMSELVARITADDEFTVMPPPESGKPLSKEEIEILKQWIAEGAEYQQHWSLIPPTRPEVPTVKNRDWVVTPIDAFILKRLEEEGVTPSEVADRRTLIRRLSFDLIGLPPTPEEVEAFVNDTSPAAYEQAVDRLLSSPHFGERLAIYWLDLVRYADTLGYHGDQVRSVSPYRDYVIRSFNENKPFDEFTIENLAGDLLPEATLWQKVASTYNRLNRASGEGGVQPKEYLAKYSADRVRTTGAVWLGSTFGCAECHDHKFDPFTTKDFYSFAAFFADVKEQGIVSGARHIAQLPVPTPEQKEELDELIQQLAKVNAEYDRRTPEREQAFAAWQKELANASDQWIAVTPTEAVSTGGATLTVQESGSVLASGKNPANDVYEIQIPLNVKELGGLRLEILPHDSLPAKGPGRAGNGNLVLQKVEATINDQPVTWKTGVATHSQNSHSGQYVVDGNPNGWAILPQTGKDNSLLLQAKETVKVPESSNLKIRLHQNFGNSHTLGHFRFYVTESAEQASPASLANDELVVLIKKPERTDAEINKLWDEFRQRTPMLAEVRKQRDALQKRKQAVEKSVVTTLATEATDPREMRVLPRGNWMDDSGQVVTPQVPEFLPQPAIDEDRRLNRLDLARWLVDERNPLVARTFVNRLWMLYFGHGLSRSVDDLGSQGAWPTHPELLDWLAVDFRENNWDIKRIIKMMVMSNTYRQTSKPSPELRARDPYNKFYARQTRWRLDAEMIRDNALSISGLLVDELGGESVMPYQPAGYWAQLNFPKRTYQHDRGAAQYRRGVYTHWQRTFLHPSLLAFDAPAREECTARRERSNTPLQALVLLNDPTYVEAARKFAERILREGGSTLESKLDYAWQRALSRQPTKEERRLLEELIRENLKRYANDTAAADQLLQTGLAPVAEGIDPTELAAWTAAARTILNLHETITRY
ncbi:MAG: DUF1553 domain-containing protein [Planctomycetaceae bacterium]|nr:DUF1553 domain-containing protein [Planctomycetaceae bacterium]